MQSLLKKHKLLTLLFLAGVLLILNLSSQSVRGTFSSLLSPVQSLLWKAGTSTVEIFSKVSQERAWELETENLLLRQKLLLVQEVAKENERLREALDIASREEFNLLFTEIIGKEVERDVLLLNKGAQDGVKQGMPVITQSKVAVGSIGEVFEHTSKVLLLSLSGRSSDVKIQGKEVIGVLKGQGRYRVLLDLIPQEEELLEGDAVVTSALGGVFPDNLLIGDVKSIEKSDLTAFQGGKVELFFQLRKENSLFILTNYQ
ncbi:rod shape-determining protein MreC [Patescibacteria group bacterium]|nr:rod shape-determining protein MreC [Patescibacteria group bacterium]